MSWEFSGTDGLVLRVLPHGTLHIHEAGSLRGPICPFCPCSSPSPMGTPPTSGQAAPLSLPSSNQSSWGQNTGLQRQILSWMLCSKHVTVSWMLEENSLPLEPNSDFSSWGEWSLISTTELSTNRRTNSPWMSSCDTVIYNKTDILSFIYGFWHMAPKTPCNVLYKSLGGFFGYNLVLLPVPGNSSRT